MTQRIIFVDIDGPVINTPCYYVDTDASMLRAVMNTQAIGYLNKLAKIANALIVTNSTHNNFTPRETGRTLKKDLLKWGIKEELLHINWRTTFPWPTIGDIDPFFPAHPRMRAITEWQQINGSADWIAFDDDVFVEASDTRLIVIDFERGVDYDAFSKACEYWKVKV
jgi:hypothetical protein